MMQALYLTKSGVRDPLSQVLSILLLTPFCCWRPLLQNINRLVGLPMMKKELQAQCNLARLMIERVQAGTWKYRGGFQLTNTGQF